MTVTRADLDALPAYVPGRRPSSDSTVPSARLASNESPLAPLPTVQDAMHAAVADTNRYPDMGSANVIEAIAHHLALPRERIAVGGGSSSLIRDLVASVAGTGDEIIFPVPSFQYYANAAIVAGATPVPVPLDREYRNDLDALLAAITPRTRAVFVCNPNNPTGTVRSRDEIREFVGQVPSDVLAVIDEAYVEFCKPSIDSLSLLSDLDNVAILRTFSKAYGLAGLRIGYLIGHEALVACVRKVIVPFALSSVAQAAACASLTTAAQTELASRVEQSVQSRDDLFAVSTGLGIDVVPSQANFLFFPIGQRSQDLVALCESEGILVRAAGDGVRITVGDASENRRLVSVLTEWAARGE